jgi:hypothetical protein
MSIVTLDWVRPRVDSFGLASLDRCCAKSLTQGPTESLRPIVNGVPDFHEARYGSRMVPSPFQIESLRSFSDANLQVEQEASSRDRSL